MFASCTPFCRSNEIACTAELPIMERRRIIEGLGTKNGFNTDFEIRVRYNKNSTKS